MNLKNIPSYPYWNNIEIENSKEKNLSESLMLADLIVYFRKLNNKYFYKKINILDLGCGNCWTLKYINKRFKVRNMYCIDFSKIRLDRITTGFYNNIRNIHVINLDMHNTKINDNNIDIIILSQALHHSYNPNKLLNECYRILKKNGNIIVIGEPKYNFIRVIISRFRNKNSGDKMYNLKNYTNLFKENKLSFKTLIKDSNYHNFILNKIEE